MDDRSAPRKRGLGRGLGALITSTEPHRATDEATTQANVGGIRQIDVDAISPNPHQPRTRFDEAAIEELAASIREHGILQPLIVTASTETTGRFWLVAGERRWRAARLAGMNHAPAIIREASPQQLMEWALVENVQRADLNPLEEATAYRALMQEYGLTQADVAARVGKSRSAVANTVRLLQLPPAIQEALLAGAISEGHARAMLALPDEQAMATCLEQVTTRDLSVRQTEELVKWMLESPQEGIDEGLDETADLRPVAEISDEELLAHYRSLEGRFRNSLGTRVNLNRNPDGSGRLVIHFYNDDDLNHLYERFIDESDH